MPVVSGRHPRALLQESALRLGDVVEIGIEVAETLDHRHAHGVIHRDAKPENIMVARHGGEKLRVRIMDFGLRVHVHRHRAGGRRYRAQGETRRGRNAAAAPAAAVTGAYDSGSGRMGTPTLVPRPVRIGVPSGS